MNLEEYRKMMKESYDSPVDGYSMEKEYFEPLSKLIPFDKVRKVLCYTSESNIDDEMELSYIFSSLSEEIEEKGRFNGWEGDVIVRKPIETWFDWVYIVEIIIPGMTSIDIFIIEEK